MRTLSIAVIAMLNKSRKDETMKRTNRKQIKIRWNGRFYFTYKFPAYVSNDPMAVYEQWNYEE